jgi:diacylglycerol kinase family enzyme
VSSPSAHGGEALVLVNPRASRLTDPVRRRRVVEAVTAAVRQRTGRAPLVEDRSLEASRAALGAAVDAPLVVVIGGDGTVREAAAALAGRETPLAVMPAGTGNVLAQGLGIRGMSTALEAIQTGRPRRLDLGVARRSEAGDGPAAGGSSAEQVFTVACGMGLDARIMAAAEHEWKRRLRFGAYVGAAVRELARLTSSRFRIVADGETIDVDAYLVLVANAGELIPGRVGPRQPIDPTDGHLDLIVLGGRAPLGAIHGAARLLLSQGELSGQAVRRPVRAVTIEAEPPQPIEIDGDALPAGRLEARVLPGAISILVPTR